MQMRGGEVLIARSDDSPCPVGVVENFWHRGGMIRRPRFGDESSTQTVDTNSAGSRCHTYSRANQLFKNELKTEGLDPKCYGLHSLRSGGATTAAAMGIPDNCFRDKGVGTVPGRRTIILISLLTLYCLLLSLCRVHDITSSIVVSCGGRLHQLPAVCEKCYFLLAEV